MGLTRFAIHRPLTVLMGILALVLMGGVAYTYLHVDRLPPVTIGVVSVSSSLPNASAQNVELLVTEPIENAISGISRWAKARGKRRSTAAARSAWRPSRSPWQT